MIMNNYELRVLEFFYKRPGFHLASRLPAISGWRPSDSLWVQALVESKMLFAQIMFGQLCFGLTPAGQVLAEEKEAEKAGWHRKSLEEIINDPLA